MRAVSTVVDVTVCLLLVSAAVAALAVPAVRGPTVDASQSADALGRTTTNVTFRVDAAGSAGPIHRVSGTHAGLLGRAALSNLHLDGQGLAPGAAEFQTAVENVTERALAWSGTRTSVTATWSPYPGAPLAGRVHVGARPPTGVDVATATVRVPVPVDDHGTELDSAASEGYAAIGRIVAGNVLDLALPRDGIRTPDRASHSGRVTRRRLQVYEEALGVDTADGGVETRVARVESALAERLTADLRARFESPPAAAAAIRLGTARVVVREWEP